MKIIITVFSIMLASIALQAQPQSRIDHPMNWAPGTTVLRSNDGRYWLDYQVDGNLVLYTRPVSGYVTARWASNTNGKTPRVLSFQSDGNLVCYGYNPNVVWAANCHNKGGKILTLQNDGNLVIYTYQNKPIWSTDTWERR